MSEFVSDITKSVSRVVLGKEEEIRLALTCLFAGGHLLIEDLPGIGKTTMAYALARVLGLDFNRIQFTNDLLPGDILGVGVYEQKNAQFVFHPGPVFTHILLADEINRATPKTQSALLEAMEEGQVTVEGESRPLNTPFFVIATQNPLEQAGTFPLPESQMDRFLMRLSLGYPDRRAEKRILKGEGSAGVIADLACCMENIRVSQIQDEVAQVHASEHFLEYLQDILEFTRTSGEFQIGLSPRAGLSLLRAAKAWAYIMGRDYTIPEDLQEIMPWVVGHRLRLRHDLGHLSGKKLMDLFSQVRIPV